MDAVVHAILKAKARKVFLDPEDQRHFLSFPAAMVGFPKDRLSFLATQELGDIREFSKIVNLLPGGEDWSPPEARFLWEPYSKVINEARYAVSTRTAGEEGAYQRARQFLQVVAEDGGVAESPAYRSYKEYRDAFFVATERYRTAVDSATHLTDPEEIRRWETEGEPRLRQEVTSCEALWATEGFKNDVEEAQNLIVSLGARSPLQTWSEWKAHFNPDLDTLTDPTDQSSAFISSFCPTNALDDGAWSSARLIGSELHMLKEELPAELSPGSVDCANLESVTCEYSTAAIIRPWFASDALEARFWRFTDPTIVFSDGLVPASGICPAYATAIVFVRNVKASRKSGSASPPPRPHLIGPLRVPGFVKVFRQQPRTPGMVAPRPMAARPALLSRAAFRAPVGTLTGRSVAGAHPEGTSEGKVVPPGGAAMGARRIDGSRLRGLQGRAFSRRVSAMVRPSVTPPIGPAPDATPAPDEGLVHILAFICTRLPLCPNPEPTLQWELS